MERESVEGRLSCCQSGGESNEGDVDVTETSGTGERSLDEGALVMDSCNAALVAFVLLMRAEIRLEWSMVVSALLNGEIWVSSSVLATKLLLPDTNGEILSSAPSSDIPSSTGFLFEPAEERPECNSICAVTFCSVNWSVDASSKTLSWLGKRVVTLAQCTCTLAIHGDFLLAHGLFPSVHRTFLVQLLMPTHLSQVGKFHQAPA
jgi:hypothetical protein